MIYFPTNLTQIFYYSYLDSIRFMKINGNKVIINNTQTFEREGYHIIQINFKNNLKSLDNFFSK